MFRAHIFDIMLMVSCMRVIIDGFTEKVYMFRPLGIKSYKLSVLKII